MSDSDASSDGRERRLGRNEGLFRTVNDNLGDLNDTFSTLTNMFEIVCECGEVECLEQIGIPVDDYARVRGDSTLFVLIPGHEDASVESVVEEGHAGYVIVRKQPGAVDAAAETGPE